MGERHAPNRSLDPCLQGILKGTPGEERISRALALANVFAIEQLEAIGVSVQKGSTGPTSLESRPEADIVADRILRVAAHQEPEEWKTSIGKDEREKVSTKAELVAFWHTWGPSIGRLAEESRRQRSHGILHHGGGEEFFIKVIKEPPEVHSPSVLGRDHKKRRLCPADVDEILPPRPKTGDGPASLQDWENEQQQTWILRLARIAQRAGTAAKIWNSIQNFAAVDRDRIWTDTLGASEWRTTRSVCYAFEALERWHQRRIRTRSTLQGTTIYPPDIDGLVQYLLDRDKEPKGCPKTLAGSLRTAVVVVCTRLQIAPLPDWTNPIWTSQVTRLKKLKPKKDSDKNAVPIPPGFI